MGKLGKLTPENIEKSIESLTFLQAQLNEIPAEIKVKLMEIAQEQAETLILTLLRLLLVTKDSKSGFDVIGDADKSLFSSHRIMNRLIREKVEIYLDELKRGADIELHHKLSAIYNKVGTD